MTYAPIKLWLVRVELAGDVIHVGPLTGEAMEMFIQVQGATHPGAAFERLSLTVPAVFPERVTAGRASGDILERELRRVLGPPAPAPVATRRVACRLCDGVHTLVPFVKEPNPVMVLPEHRRPGAAPSTTYCRGSLTEDYRPGVTR